MLNVYLHFEALTDHSYSFSCVLCVNFPPLLTLDVDKKSVFELAGIVLFSNFKEDFFSLFSVFRYENST